MKAGPERRGPQRHAGEPQTGPGDSPTPPGPVARVIPERGPIDATDRPAAPRVPSASEVAQTRFQPSRGPSLCSLTPSGAGSSPSQAEGAERATGSLERQREAFSCPQTNPHEPTSERAREQPRGAPPRSMEGSTSRERVRATTRPQHPTTHSKSADDEGGGRGR